MSSYPADNFVDNAFDLMIIVFDLCYIPCILQPSLIMELTSE